MKSHSLLPSLLRFSSAGYLAISKSLLPHTRCFSNHTGDICLDKFVTDCHDIYLMAANSRSFPDVRDGLKTVQRRILFYLHRTPESGKSFLKCLEIGKEVTRIYHPHRQVSVHQALIRMSMLPLPLLERRGVDEVPTECDDEVSKLECRLHPLAEDALLADLDMETVEFSPSFRDPSLMEPLVLPARLPIILLNGPKGLGVAMNSNIPPHNLGELVDVLCRLIRSPEATLQELLEHMPGPDFPSGGLIMGKLGILNAYQTGKGCVVVRAKTNFEVLDLKTNAIIINEIPYRLRKKSLLKQIADLVENKCLRGITAVRDESDCCGMRIVIELKEGSDPSMLLDQLYRLTPLQSCFTWNMVCIVDGHPKLMSLKELLQSFIDFRCTTIERRARFKLPPLVERKHIIEGVLLFLDNLEKVKQIVAESNTTAYACLRNEFGLSEKQAEILSAVDIKKLICSEREQLIDERNLLMDKILKEEELLSSRQAILQVIEQEALELKSKFSTPRRTSIEDSDGLLLESKQ